MQREFRLGLLFATTLLGLAVTACSPVPATEGASPVATAVVTATPAVMGPQEQMVAMARADLAQRLGITQDEIQVSQVEASDWPDASLGCPEPGMLYPQVITPGYRIILVADGQEYDYRASTKSVRLCQQ